MWAAADFAKMYPNPLGSKGRTVQFEVDSESPDFDRHPLAAGPWTGGGPWEVVVEPGQLLFIPAFTIHQVSAMETHTISCNIFFGDESESRSAYIGKLLAPPVLDAFTFWLCNIIQQNQPLESFANLLGYLRRSLAGFCSNQWSAPRPRLLPSTRSSLSWQGSKGLPAFEDKAVRGF